MRQDRCKTYLDEALLLLSFAELLLERFYFGLCIGKLFPFGFHH